VARRVMPPVGSDFSGGTKKRERKSVRENSLVEKRKIKMAPWELSNNKSTIKNTNRVIISCTSITNN